MTRRRQACVGGEPLPSVQLRLFRDSDGGLKANLPIRIYKFFVPFCLSERMSRYMATDAATTTMKRPVMALQTINP